MREDKVSKKFDVFHYQGPIVFFSITIIIIIQLVQLLHYDISQIYNTRSSLNSIFSIEITEKSTPQDLLNEQLFLASVTSKTQFKNWLTRVANSTFRPEVGEYTLLFPSKTITLGDVVIIKYETKDTGCKTKVPGNKSCIATSYSDDTKSRPR